LIKFAKIIKKNSKINKLLKTLSIMGKMKIKTCFKMFKIILNLHNFNLMMYNLSLIKKLKKKISTSTNPLYKKPMNMKIIFVEKSHLNLFQKAFILKNPRQPFIPD
jgi:hypothetical protein